MGRSMGSAAPFAMPEAVRRQAEAAAAAKAESRKRSNVASEGDSSDLGGYGEPAQPVSRKKRPKMAPRWRVESPASSSKTSQVAAALANSIFTDAAVASPASHDSTPLASLPGQYSLALSMSGPEDGVPSAGLIQDLEDLAELGSEPDVELPNAQQLDLLFDIPQLDLAQELFPVDEAVADNVVVLAIHDAESSGSQLLASLADAPEPVVEQIIENTRLGVATVDLDSDAKPDLTDIEPALYPSEDSVTPPECVAEAEMSYREAEISADEVFRLIHGIQDGMDEKEIEELIESFPRDEYISPGDAFWGIDLLDRPLPPVPQSMQPPPDRRGQARRHVDLPFLDAWAKHYKHKYKNHPMARLLFEDIIAIQTTNEPKAPEIRVINEVDDPRSISGGPPPDFEFQYSNELLYHPSVPDPELGLGCDCDGPCDPTNQRCSCVRRQELYFYQTEQRGFQYDHLNGGAIKQYDCPIWECGPTCGCPPECMNRVIQRGRTDAGKVSIFKTRKKGWGIQAAGDIKKGTFVGTYSGEMITDAESERRGALYDWVGRTYLFDLDAYHIRNPPDGLDRIDERAHQIAKETEQRAKRLGADEDPDHNYSAYSVDAFHWGNHSCDPNLVIMSAYTTDFHPERPKLVIVARRNIKKGEEMCISYKGIDDDAEAEAKPEPEVSPVRKGRGKGRAKTTAQIHKTPTKAPSQVRQDLCRCGADNCNGRMFF
ncbi:hypothetical protein Q5752_000326 [Cryptotrichosporon argae]